jgi:hypothetical protein
LTVNNADNFFSVNNPSSLFKDVQWRFTPVTIYDEDGELVWNGVIEDIKRNHGTKTADIITKNSLIQFMNLKVAYTSADWETAAGAAKNILDNAGFTDYNVKSFQDSKNQLENESCYIKVNFEEDDDITLQQAIEKLAEFGCADAFSHVGNIYFKHYRPFTGGIKVNLGIKDIGDPSVVGGVAVLVNDYRIGYDGDGGTPATDANSNDIGANSRAKFGTQSLREMGGGTDDQIVFKDKTSATYIGECHIRRVHIDLDKVTVKLREQASFQVPIKHDEWIDLETYFSITLSDEGWNEEPFEIFDFDRDYDRQVMNVLGYQVERASA